MPEELLERKKSALKEIGEVLEKYGFQIAVEANAVLVPNNDTTTATTGSEFVV